jgi:hypothetical protein
VFIKWSVLICRDAVTGRRRKLHNRTLRNLYRSLGNFFQWLFQPIQGPGLLFSSVINFPRLLGRVISPSHGVYLNTGQHRHRISAYTHTHTPNIHASSGIRTHDPSVRANEDSSCLRPRGYCDRPLGIILVTKWRRITWMRNLFRIVVTRNIFNISVGKTDG